MHLKKRVLSVRILSRDNVQGFSLPHYTGLPLLYHLEKVNLLASQESNPKQNLKVSLFNYVSIHIVTQCLVYLQRQELSTFQMTKTIGFLVKEMKNFSSFTIIIIESKN